MQNSLNNQMDTLFKPSNVQTLDETVDDFKEIGTGVLTGTIAIPSDIVTGAEMANTFLADYTNNPMAMLLKDNLQTLEKQYGRGAFDKGFEEITGIKSDVTNPNQLVGEILSPTGAFLTPLKLTKKLSDTASGIYDTIKNTLSKSDFVKSDLVTEGAYADPIMNIPRKDVDINKPKIDFNIVGENTFIGRDRADRYREAEYKALVESGTAKREQVPSDPTGIKDRNTREAISKKNYDMLTLPQKQKLYQETGVYRGVDGKLRYALDTKEATLKIENFKTDGNNLLVESLPANTKLKDILNYEDLFNSYQLPIKIDGFEFGSMRDIKIEVVPAKELKNKTAASYNPYTDTIRISSNTSDNILTDVMHEVQHAVQFREGFDSGSSVAAEIKKISPDVFNNKGQIVGGYRHDSILLKRKQRNELNELFNNFNDTTKDILSNTYFLNFKNLTNEAKTLLTQKYKNLNEEELGFLADAISSDPKEKIKQLKTGIEDMTTTLAKREKESYLKYGDLFLKVDPMEDMGKFSFSDANIINLLADFKPFKEYMKKRIENLVEEEKLNKIYDKAETAYYGKAGEVEARFAETRKNFVNLIPEEEQFYKSVGTNIPLDTRARRIDTMAKEGK